MASSDGIPTMSGNFDYPPASSSTVPAPTLPDDASAVAVNSEQDRDSPNANDRLQVLRRQVRAHRNHIAASGDHHRNYPPFEYHSPTALPESSADRRTRRRNMLRPTSSHGRLQMMPSAYSQSSAGSRRRQPPMNTSYERYVQDFFHPPEEMEGQSQRDLAELRAAGNRMSEVSSEIRMLLDNSASSLRTPDHLTEEYSGEAEVNRRIKRRKLDNEVPSDTMLKVSYGRFGQAEEGKLKMEIASCDGGVTNVRAEQSQNLSADNILKNDVSAYCTKRSMCNVMLQHPGRIPFCLSKLVVRAPKTGYDMPIQEGLVFLSMQTSGLLDNAKRYEMLYPPPKNAAGSVIVNAQGQRMQTSADVRLPPPPAVSYYRTGAPSRDSSQSNPSNWDPVDAGVTLAVPNECVTVSCGNDELAVEAEAALWGIPGGWAGRPDTALADDLSGSDSEGLDDEFSAQLGIPGGVYNYRRRSKPKRNEKANKILDKSMLASSPHARFFIDKDSNMCSITFNPPLSARYMLLKLFSPVEGQNIDIQSIEAFGFAGPRFIPAAECR